MITKPCKSISFLNLLMFFLLIIITSCMVEEPIINNDALKHPLTAGEESSGLYIGYTFADEITEFDGEELKNYPKNKALNGARGKGDSSGSLDVFVVGDGNSAVFTWKDKIIVNGNGDDIKIFENGFYTNGNPDRMSLDLGLVSVSQNGTDWYDIPVTYDPTKPADSPEGKIGFIGTKPVYINMTNDTLIHPSTIDAGGDSFDLSDVGISEGDYIKYVKVIDAGDTYDDGQIVSNGIDIDGVCGFYWKSED